MSHFLARDTQLSFTYYGSWPCYMDFIGSNLVRLSFEHQSCRQNCCINSGNNIESCHAYASQPTGPYSIDSNNNLPCLSSYLDNMASRIDPPPTSRQQCQTDMARGSIAGRNRAT